MSPFSSRFLLLAAASLIGARAQTTPAAPPAAPAAPHAHAHAPLVLDQFVTSASPFARNQVDLAQSTTVLSGRALVLKQQPTLGETLAGETGMAATSFGPGASRPIIRGLGGDRIRVLENSVGTIDASVVSPDHAVSIEPLLIERVEVVRGPASLLYGSNAVGGVVNVITHRIETERSAQPASGRAEVRGDTAAREFSGGGVLDLRLTSAPAGAILLHLDGFRRETRDVRIPGFAEAAPLREAEIEEALEHGEPAPRFAHGRLPNSALRSTSAAAGLSFVGESFRLGASHSGVDTNYGVPGHAHEAAPGDAAGVRLDLRQRRTDVQGAWSGHGGLFTGARFKFGHARYRHAEIEPDGAVGTVFSHHGHDARLELLHGDAADPLAGAIGAQSVRSDFAAAGAEAFLPPSRTRSDAVFAFEELTRGSVAWQFGGRVERTRIAPENARARRFTELNGSAGLVWKIDPAWSLAASLSHTGRAPNTQELFAHGPHAGTQTFETGDRSLQAERSLGIEAGVRRRAGLVTGALTVFTNRFRGYIFEEPTGLVAIEHDEEWEFLPRDDEEAHEHDGGLPLFRYAQRDARFWGAELETIWHLHERREWQLDLRLAADRVRGRAAGRDLPRIPATRTTAGLIWATDAWSVGAEAQWVFDQKRVAPDETPSEGYTLVSAHVSRAFTSGRVRWEAFVRGANLADDEARPHPSFVKQLAPLAGRNVTVGVRMGF